MFPQPLKSMGVSDWSCQTKVEDAVSSKESCCVHSLVEQLFAVTHVLVVPVSIMNLKVCGTVLVPTVAETHHGVAPLFVIAPRRSSNTSVFSASTVDLTPPLRIFVRYASLCESIISFFFMFVLSLLLAFSYLTFCNFLVELAFR